MATRFIEYDTNHLRKAVWVRGNSEKKNFFSFSLPPHYHHQALSQNVQDSASERRQTPESMLGSTCSENQNNFQSSKRAINSESKLNKTWSSKKKIKSFLLE